MIRNLKAIALVGIAATAISAGSAKAAVLYSTTFNAPTYANGALIGQDSWAITGSTVTNPVAVSGLPTDGVVGLTTSGQDVNRVYTAAPVGTTSIFAGLDLTVSAAQGGDYFFHLGDGGSSNFYGRLFAKSVTGGYQLALGTSSGTPAAGAYGATLSFGTEYRIVIQYDSVAGTANDTGAIYVDPTTASPLPTPYMAAVTQGIDATDIPTIDSVNLRQGTAGSAATVVVDDIIVATTFGEAADLAAVPEPATLGLLSLGGLAALRRRRA